MKQLLGSLGLALLATSMASVSSETANDCGVIFLDRNTYMPGDIATLSIFGEPGLIPLVFFSPTENAATSSPFPPRVLPPIPEGGSGVLMERLIDCDDPEKFMQVRLLDPRTREDVCVTNEVFLSIVKPAGICEKGPRMTGGGSVFQEGTGLRFTHGFELHCDPDDVPNNLEINWAGHRFHLLELTSAVCTDDPELNERPPRAGFDTFEGTGTGRLNNVPGASIVFKLTDAGEPGTGDRFEFTIDDGVGDPIVVSGFLVKGNHQAHRN